MNKLSNLILVFIGFQLFVSCSFGTKKKGQSFLQAKQDSIKLKEELWKRDIKTIEYGENIDVICAQIDAQLNTFKVDSVDVFESAEGGLITYYSKKNELRKIIEHQYGGLGQVERQYYLNNMALVYCLESNVSYNAHFTHPDFDEEQSAADTSQFYFKEEKPFDLFTQDCGAPTPQNYIDSFGNDIIEHLDFAIKQFNNQKK